MDSRLLKKFYRGACSPEEIAEVLSWFEKEGLQPDQEQGLYRLWQEAEHQKQEPEYTRDATRILASLNQAIDSQEAEPANFQAGGEVSPEVLRNTNQWAWVLKAAVAVLVPVCFLWLLLSYFGAAERGRARLVTHEAPRGTRKTIRLADGSTVILNAGSSITYPEPFAAGKREITLQGEAFFEVAKDSLHPFIVRTGQLTTHALGTSFNIKYHNADKIIAVALATGAVKIAENAKGACTVVARLEPGQQLEYDRENRGYVVRPFNPMEVLGWRQGILYFKKANLNQVVGKLENWYGVDIQIETKGRIGLPEKEWLYTGTFDNQRLEDVLAGISFVKDFTYEKKGNTWILKFH